MSYELGRDECATPSFAGIPTSQSEHSLLNDCDYQFRYIACETLRSVKFLEKSRHACISAIGENSRSWHYNAGVLVAKKDF
jgi:hypothetical protein